MLNGITSIYCLEQYYLKWLKHHMNNWYFNRSWLFCISMCCLHLCFHIHHFWNICSNQFWQHYIQQSWDMYYLSGENIQNLLQHNPLSHTFYTTWHSFYHVAFFMEIFTYDGKHKSWMSIQCLNFPLIIWSFHHSSCVD